MVIGNGADIATSLLDWVQRASDSIEYHVLLLVCHSLTCTIHEQEASLSFLLESSEFPLDVVEYFIELGCRCVLNLINVAVRNAKSMSDLPGVNCVLLCRR